MACLAFGRAASAPHPGCTTAADCGCQLAVEEDEHRVAAESAVFDSLARQVTAFVANLDEATVNVGAAEPQTIRISSSSSSGGGGGSGGSIGGSASGAGVGSSRLGSPYSVSGGDSGSKSARTHTVGSSDSGVAAPPSLFRRLRAAPAASGFGWRDSRAAFELAVKRENRQERLVARSDTAAAEKRLQQRLLVARLEALAFRGCSGGNSLFAALSLAVWGTAAHAPTLRALAVQYAAAHPQEYRCFLGDDWEAYLSGMAQPGTPGDELMVRAVADHFGLAVHMVTSDAFMWFQRYSPARMLSHREATLAFLGPCTWMPVRRQSTLSALRLSLTGSSEWRQAREVRRRMRELEHGGQPGAPSTPPGSPMAY